MDERATEKPVTLLHTSDWHLGRALSGRRRYEEFQAFLEWLASTIIEAAVDVVVVAGDIFDTTAPSHRSQELYYRFLHQVAGDHRHIVIVGGNHDSPTFLDAPGPLLETLNVHVVGAAPKDPADEVILLRRADGTPFLIVLAVPFLKDRDVRLASEGESAAEKDAALTAGISRHFHAVYDAADRLRRSLDTALPIVATGHLFTQGATKSDRDGARELYVGTLARVDAATLPDAIDYLALGHLHRAQTVGGHPAKRYSGAPLHLGFDELGETKSVTLVALSSAGIDARLIPVPVFQEKAQITGDLDTIVEALRALTSRGTSVWVEAVYDGEALVSNLRDKLQQVVEGSAVQLLRIRNARPGPKAFVPVSKAETLETLTVDEVFERCLIAHDIPPDQRAELTSAFHDIVASLERRDTHAE